MKGCCIKGQSETAPLWLSTSIVLTKGLLVLALKPASQSLKSLINVDLGLPSKGRVGFALIKPVRQRKLPSRKKRQGRFIVWPESTHTPAYKTHERGRQGAKSLCAPRSSENPLH